MISLLAVLGFMALLGLATRAAEDAHTPRGVMVAPAWALVHARQ
jgi:hypothetical protein